MTYIAGTKCLDNGCSKIVLTKTGYCKDHRKMKCKLCKRDFIPGIYGTRICCTCSAETIRIDRGIALTMGR